MTFRLAAGVVALVLIGALAGCDANLYGGGDREADANTAVHPDERTANRVCGARRAGL
jgi:hypothetical protein